MTSPLRCRFPALPASVRIRNRPICSNLRTAQDNGGVHINSEIPSRAFYLAAVAIGGNAWEKAGQIWYDTIRDRSLRSRATFAAFAGRTVANAGHRYGANGTEQKAVADAWRQVGVKPS